MATISVTLNEEHVRRAIEEAVARISVDIEAIRSETWDKAVTALREAHFVAADSYADYLDSVKAEVLGGGTTT